MTTTPLHSWLSNPTVFLAFNVALTVVLWVTTAGDASAGIKIGNNGG